MNIVARRSHIAGSGLSVGKGKREREKKGRGADGSETQRESAGLGLEELGFTGRQSQSLSLSLSLSLSRTTKEDRQATWGHTSCDFSSELRKEKLLPFLCFPWRRIRQPGITVVLCMREGGKEGRM